MTPLRCFLPIQVVLGTVLLFGASVLLGSCGGAGSKRASLYQRLVNEGPWAIEDLDGDEPRRLDERYTQVRLTFRGEAGGRRYRMVGQFSPDSTAVLAEGAVALRGDDGLLLASGFDRVIRWRYEFQASRAVFALQFGSRVFLRRLFPGTTWSDSRDVTMTLARTDG